MNDTEIRDTEIRDTVLRCLREIAPDADPAQLAPDADLRDELDLDSMDFLRFVQALHRELGVVIPEAEYGAIRTLDACVDRVSRAAQAR